jgi:exodeoxyribonuclease-3
MADVAGIRIINVYVPNGQSVGSDKFQFKLGWMKRLRALLDETCDVAANVLLCGDFNVAPEERDVHDPRLWQNRILFSDVERAALQHIKEWGFTDTFRLHTDEGGIGPGGLSRRRFSSNLGLRIDHARVPAASPAKHKDLD